MLEDPIVSGLKLNMLDILKLNKMSTLNLLTDLSIINYSIKSSAVKNNIINYWKASIGGRESAFF